jgi:hypothetical protein
MSTPTYAEALKAAQHQALDQAVTDGRITPEQKAVAADLLDGKITEDEARARYEALAEVDG